MYNNQKNGAGMSEINSPYYGYSSFAIGVNNVGSQMVTTPYWIDGSGEIGIGQGNLPLNGPFGSLAGRSPSLIGLDPSAYSQLAPTVALGIDVGNRPTWGGAGSHLLPASGDALSPLADQRFAARSTGCVRND